MKKFSWLKASFGLIATVCLLMIYWSSTLIEENLHLLHRELKELKQETTRLSHKMRQLSIQGGETAKVEKTKTSLADPKYSNLLEEDPYFSKTLPNLLGENFKPTGFLREAMIGRPEHLHPFNGFKDVSKMFNMCVVQVAELQFGKYETMAPDMAIKLEERPRKDREGLTEYWVHLRDDVYWQPLNSAHFPQTLELSPWFFKKHPVTAHDFKFFFDAVMNPYVSEAKAASLRSYYGDIEDFIVLDDHTFVVRWKPHQTADGTLKTKYTSLGLTGALQPLPRFVFQYFSDGKKIIEEDSDPTTYQKNSIWAQNFQNHFSKNVIVGCGGYFFDGMNEEGIRFVRNDEHYNPLAVLVEGIEFKFKESTDAVWQDFKSGKIDFCTVSPNQLGELEAFLESCEYQKQKAKKMAIESLDYVDMSYQYIGWNTAKPFFANSKIRKAFTLAIDRSRVIEQNLNQMAVPISGPFFRFSPSYDEEISPLPFNLEKARALLEEEGWVDLDGDGIREKIVDGQKIPFNFKLYYFVKSLSAKVISEFIATSLKEIGVNCQFSGLDITDLSRQFDDKNFDALFMGWKLGTPPEDPRQLWHSAGAKEKGSSNMIGFSNKRIDGLIEKLNYEYDKQTRRRLYHEFHQIIHDEQPYTFLYTPKIRLLYRQYVKNLFIPREKQDLIPGANIPEPNTQVIWLDKK